MLKSLKKDGPDFPFFFGNSGDGPVMPTPSASRSGQCRSEATRVAMRRACVSSSTRWMAVSWRVVRCFLFGGVGRAGDTRRVSAGGRCVDGGLASFALLSPGSDSARRLRDSGGQRGLCLSRGHLPRVTARAHDRPHLQQRGACTVPTSTEDKSTAVDRRHAHTREHTAR